MKPGLTRLALLFAVLWIASSEARGQQDPMFTKYFFNTLVYNPAYAGSREHLSIVVLAREQWLGWNGGGDLVNPNGGGAPHSQTLTVHTPLQGRVGIGLSVFNDKIGATASTGFTGSYAYRIPFGKAKLALGINAGIAQWRADWSNLSFKDPREYDAAFLDDKPSRIIPQVGAGVYYYMDHFYIGLSAPRLFNFDLRQSDQAVSTTKIAKSYSHFYLTSGGGVPLRGDDIVFKPSILVKRVGLFNTASRNKPTINSVGAPTEFEVDLSLFFYKKFWVGAAFRSAIEAVTDLSSSDSADIWAAFYMRNGLRLGLAYDFPLTELRNFSAGSFEIMLGYDFEYRVQKVLTPRYF
jgi:type IX secretion system PorP/SprF family membrane protein